MENHNLKINTVIINRPARKLVFKSGNIATNYFEYCDEVGCDVWKSLSNISAAISEPMGIWLPLALRRNASSEYVQGIEVESDCKLADLLDFDSIHLPASQVIIFQGPPFEELYFKEAIRNVQKYINEFRPENIGLRWSDESAPRFQYEPIAKRGYIEGRGVMSVGHNLLK